MLLAILDRLVDQCELEARISERFFERCNLALQFTLTATGLAVAAHCQLDSLPCGHALGLDRRNAHAELLAQHVDALLAANQRQHRLRPLLGTSTAGPQYVFA